MFIMKYNFFKDVAKVMNHNDMITIDAVVPVDRFGIKCKQVSYWDRSSNHNGRYTTIVPIDKDINKGDVVSKKELLEEADRLHNKMRDAYKKDFHDFVQRKETRDTDSYTNDVEDAER